MKSCFGQNEDYSLGDSLSHRSEGICQRNVCVCVCVRARTQCISFFGEGGTCSQVHIWQRLAASREEQISPFCSCKKIQDTRLIKSFFESVSFSFPRALRASYLISALKTL